MISIFVLCRMKPRQTNVCLFRICTCQKLKIDCCNPLCVRIHNDITITVTLGQLLCCTKYESVKSQIYSYMQQSVRTTTFCECMLWLSPRAAVYLGVPPHPLKNCDTRILTWSRHPLGHCTRHNAHTHIPTSAKECPSALSSIIATPSCHCNHPFCTLPTR